MKNILNSIKLIVITVLCIQLIACESKNDDIILENSFIINKVKYTATSASYIVNTENISLHFGNRLTSDNESLAKQIEIVINTKYLTENHFYYPHNDDSKLILSAIYSYKEDGEIKRVDGLSKGEISLIRIDKFYIVEYNLKIDDNTIEGYFAGEIYLNK